MSRGLLDLGRGTDSDESVSGLELLHRLDGVVDEGKAGGLAATVLGSHAEDGDLVGVGFVDFGEFGAEVIFRHVGAVGVQHITVTWR